MNEELYRLISLSNRVNLKEEEVLELLRRAILIVAGSIKKTYALSQEDLVKEYLKVSYANFKLLYDDLTKAYQAIMNDEKVDITVPEINLPEWQEVNEEKRETMIAIIDASNEAFDFMYDLVESNLTMKSYAYTLKKVLHHQMSILGAIAVGI